MRKVDLTMDEVMAKSIENAEHYIGKSNHCNGWHLLNDTSISVIQEPIPAVLQDF